MLTTTALTGLKNYVKNTVASAKYKVGSNYYDAEITNEEIDERGRVIIDVLIDHTISGDITVTEVRLFDHNGSLWASKAEAVSRADVQEGMLYRFAFTITEVEA